MSVETLGRGLVALALGCLLLAPDARGRIDEIRIEPVEPVEGQPIAIHVLGTLLDGCWELKDWTCEAPPDSVPSACNDRQLLPIEVNTHNTFDPNGDEGCAEIEFPFEVECTYSSLPAGEYCAVVTERKTSVALPPLAPDVEFLPFTVQAPTPTRLVSWAALKTVYR